MKASKIFITLVFVALGITAVYFIKNESLRLQYGTDITTGKTHTYHPTKRSRFGVLEMSENQFNALKKKERNKILLIGLGTSFLLLLIYFFFKQQEDKKDPKKKLLKLKNESVLSQSEYEQKIDKLKRLNENELSEKEQNKLINELSSLKDRGLLTESEYNEKVKLVKEKK